MKKHEERPPAPAEAPRLQPVPDRVNKRRGRDPTPVGVAHVHVRVVVVVIEPPPQTKCHVEKCCRDERRRGVARIPQYCRKRHDVGFQAPVGGNDVMLSGWKGRQERGMHRKGPSTRRYDCLEQHPLIRQRVNVRTRLPLVP